MIRLIGGLPSFDVKLCANSIDIHSGWVSKAAI